MKKRLLWWFLFVAFVGWFSKDGYAQNPGAGLPNVTTLPTPCRTTGSNVTVYKTTTTIGPYYCGADLAWHALTGGVVGAAFNAITTGTNTTATMTVGSGATLTFTGTGIINANRILGTTLTGLTGTIKMTSGIPSVAAFSDLPITAANIVGKWTGTPDGAKFLRDDGVLATPAGGSGCVPAGSAGQILVDDAMGGCTATPVTIDSTMGVAGGIQMPQGTAPTVGSNVFGFVAPTTMTTSQLLRSPNAVTAAHQVMVMGAPSSNISSWAYKTLPNCVDTGGNHLNFTQSTDEFSCGTSGGGGCTVIGNSGDYLIPGATSPVGYRQYGNKNVANPAGLSANTTLLFRVFIPCAWTPDRISFSISDPGMAGCMLSVGIYDDSKTLIISSGVLTDATTVDCDNSGTRALSAGTSPAATGLGTPRAAGFYWIACTSNEVVSTIEALWFGDATAGDILNATSANLAFLNGAQVTTNGALNASFTTGSGFNSGGISFVPVMILSKN